MIISVVVVFASAILLLLKRFYYLKGKAATDKASRVSASSDITIKLSNPASGSTLEPLHPRDTAAQTVTTDVRFDAESAIDFDASDSSESDIPPKKRGYFLRGKQKGGNSVWDADDSENV